MASETSSLRGALRPRVECTPGSARSYGRPAADLARAAGLALEPWQVAGLETALAVTDDEQWAAYEYAELCPRQNGKTAMIMARALAGMFLLDEQVVIWSAHQFRTAMRAFRDMRRMIRTLGTPVSDQLIYVDDIPVKVNNSAGNEGFERLDTGQEIKMVARSKDAARGFSIDCMVIDEAYDYTEDQQDAAMPTLAARPNPQILYASSPPLHGRHGGPLYALKARAEAGGDETLAWRDWGAPMTLDELLALPAAERAAVLDDRALWAATNPAFGLGRVSETSVLRLRRGLSEAGFAREILGMWPAPAAAQGLWLVIAEERWGDLLDEESVPSGRGVLALDAAPDHSSGAIAFAGSRSDGLGHVEITRHAPGTGWLLDETIRMYREHRPRAVVLDPGSAAGAVIAGLGEAGIEPLLVTGREMAQACGAFHTAAVETRTFRHRGQPELNRAVANGTRRRLGDAWAWDRRTPDADISPLVAATLAWHGWAKDAARRRAPRVW